MKTGLGRFKKKKTKEKKSLETTLEHYKWLEVISQGTSDQYIQASEVNIEGKNKGRSGKDESRESN